MPYSRNACVAYSEHVGSYLQRRGSAGEIKRRYSWTGARTAIRAHPPRPRGRQPARARVVCDVPVPLTAEPPIRPNARQRCRGWDTTSSCRSQQALRSVVSLMLTLQLPLSAGRSQQAGPAEQLAQSATDAAEALPPSQLAGLRAGDDDDVVAGTQPGLGGRERLPQQPLDPVSLDRAADLARHRQAEPGSGFA